MQNPSPVSIGVFRDWPDYTWRQGFTAISFTPSFWNDREIRMRFGDSSVIRYIVGDTSVTIVTTAGEYETTTSFELPLVSQQDTTETQVLVDSGDVKIFSERRVPGVPRADPVAHLTEVKKLLSKYQTHTTSAIQANKILVAQLLIRHNKLTLDAILPHLNDDSQFWIYGEDQKTYYRESHTLIVYQPIQNFLVEVFKISFTGWAGVMAEVRAIRC